MQVMYIHSQVYVIAIRYVDIFLLLQSHLNGINIVCYLHILPTTYSV